MPRSALGNHSSMAIADVKCWATAMLILALLSGNLAIFIIGIIGSAMVLCCASVDEQVSRNASCFKRCAIACAVLGGLHAVGLLALGSVFVATTADCTDKLKGNSCAHLDGRRQLGSASHGSLRVAALATFVRHTPLLLGTVTGGASLVVPSLWLGAALAKPSRSPALTGPTRARHLAVSGCGLPFGPPAVDPAESRSYILASSGATDCAGCGEDITSYEDCEVASASGANKFGIAVLEDKSSTGGPKGCHIEDRSQFKYNTNLECASHRSMRGHTPVCLCELNYDKTTCLNFETRCTAGDSCIFSKDGDCDDGSDAGSTAGLCLGSTLGCPCDVGSDTSDCGKKTAPVTKHDGNRCRDWEKNGHCCWSSDTFEEPLACDSGYRPELPGGDCLSNGVVRVKSGEIMTCKKDLGYTTQDDCEAHITQFCQERFASATGFFFAWMVWEIVGVVVYAVAACKAAHVLKGGHVAPNQGGTQMQSQFPQMQPQMQQASAQAMPQGAVVFATAVAQPVAATPVGMPQALTHAVPMGRSQAVPCA